MTNHAGELTIKLKEETNRLKSQLAELEATEKALIERIDMLSGKIREFKIQP